MLGGGSFCCDLNFIDMGDGFTFICDYLLCCIFLFYILFCVYVIFYNKNY